MKFKLGVSGTFAVTAACLYGLWTLALTLLVEGQVIDNTLVARGVDMTDSESLLRAYRDPHLSKDIATMRVASKSYWFTARHATIAFIAFTAMVSLLRRWPSAPQWLTFLGVAVPASMMVAVLVSPLGNPASSFGLIVGCVIGGAFWLALAWLTRRRLIIAGVAEARTTWWLKAAGPVACAGFLLAITAGKALEAQLDPLSRGTAGRLGRTARSDETQRTLIPRNIPDVDERALPDQPHPEITRAATTITVNDGKRPVVVGGQSAEMLSTGPESDYSLGMRLWTGDGISRDSSEAAQCFLRAATLGVAEAQACLGAMYEIGDGIAQDLDEAEKWYLRAAEQGNAAGQFGLGCLLHARSTVEADVVEAARWLRLAAEHGHAEAQFSLAEMYRRGEGVEESNSSALTWYRHAADAGNLDAKRTLAAMYLLGDGLPRDTQTGTSLLEAAAKAGDGQSQCLLGIMLANGEGVSKDLAKSAEWLLRAAEQGVALAQYNLGVAYDHGLGVARDVAVAIKWYLLAADQGDKLSQRNLGITFNTGTDVPRNVSEAMKWFRLAAEQGDDVAQLNLGLLYGTGDGVTQDLRESVKWMRLAADQGNEGALLFFKAVEANKQPKLPARHQ